MAEPLKGPPASSEGVGFVWFNWFRRLYKTFVELYDNFNTLSTDFTNLYNYTYTLPTQQGGNLKSQLLTTADTSPWTWPTGVDAVWITMVGGGAGGHANESATLGGGGGGAGEYTVRRFYPRLSATTTTYTIGTKGASASNGSSTTFGTITVQGGYVNATVGYGGKGGGDAQTTPSSKVAGVRSVDEGVVTFSGANGGGAGAASTHNGLLGGGCESFSGGAIGLTGSSRGGGGGGASSPFGQGGTGGTGSNATLSVAQGAAPAATSYGAGGGGAGGYGGGAGAASGGAGQDGCILLEWIG